MAFKKFILIVLLGIGLSINAQENEKAPSFPKTTLVGIPNPSLKTLCGQNIAPYVKAISAFFNAAYREAPYFYDASEASWDKYIQSYADTPESVVCLIFSGETIIGAAIGTPLRSASNKYKMAFENRPEDLQSLFYLGELVIKPEYTHLGLGKKIYKTFQKAVIAKRQFSGICVWQLASEETAAMDRFWSRLGFESHPDIHFDELWKNVSGSEKVAHPMVCWKKTFLQTN